MLSSVGKRDLIVIAQNELELTDLRKHGWKEAVTFGSQKIIVEDKELILRDHLTFTPYANPCKCSAQCCFCSEELRRLNQKSLSAHSLIKDYDRYFLAFKEVLRDISTVSNLGLSLSGLEATADYEWFLQALKVISDSGVSFNEKVLYTNGSGLLGNVFDELYSYVDFDRFEISRIHFNEQLNNKIMRFRQGQEVSSNHNFQKLIKSLNNRVNVKLSCLLNHSGISTLVAMEEYLSWANLLGVRTVVFRELSQLNSEYVRNAHFDWIERNRISVDSILEEISKNQDWVYKESHCGYYYYNEHYTYKNGIEVILEKSSYSLLLEHNNEAMVHKLIFHSNGNLCADWDPGHKIIKSYL